jgi:3,4-dihydroxy 2-butanone 4-phosphate synthase/GTP cyclohydrolase II
VTAGPEWPCVTVPDALATLAGGGFVIVVDSLDAGATGDVLFAASHVTAERANFLIRETRGVLYLGLTDERCNQLDLPQMVAGTSPGSFQSAFTVAIEARHGVTTGISAADRARTIQVAIAPESTAADIRRPGHIFPLRAAPGGTLERAGRTEAYVDLPRLAGLYPAGVAASVINPDGSLARVPDLLEFGRRHGIGVLTVADVVSHRLRTDELVRPLGESAFWAGAELARVRRYADHVRGREYVAVRYGTRADGPVPLALALGCLEGHVLGSATCDCRARLDADRGELVSTGGLLLWQSRQGPCPAVAAERCDPYERAVLAAVVAADGTASVEPMPSAASLATALIARGLRVTGAAAASPTDELSRRTVHS